MHFLLHEVRRLRVQDSGRKLEPSSSQGRVATESNALKNHGDNTRFWWSTRGMGFGNLVRTNISYHLGKELFLAEFILFNYLFIFCYVGRLPGPFIKRVKNLDQA